MHSRTQFSTRITNAITLCDICNSKKFAFNLYFDSYKEYTEAMGGDTREISPVVFNYMYTQYENIQSKYP